MKKGKIIGVGGVFFKCPDTAKTKGWYEMHMGLKVNDYGATFRSLKASDQSSQYLQWSVFEEKSKYFINDEQQFMINYRVIHLEELLAEMETKGLTIVEPITTYDYGKFAKVADLNGLVMELWEPIDASFDDFQSHEGVNQE